MGVLSPVPLQKIKLILKANENARVATVFSDSVLVPLSRESKCLIVERIFGKIASPGWGEPACSTKSDAFWDFYLNICRKSLAFGHVQTHKDVVDAVDEVREVRSRADTRDALRKRVAFLDDEDEDDVLNGRMDLAARLVTMSSVETFEFFGETESDHCPWPDSKGLADLMSARYAWQDKLGIGNLRLQKTFTIMNLSRIGGLEIVWTWNILDHLKLTEDDTKVHIFHCMSCLHWQVDNGTPILPKEMLVEVQRTLAILVPKKNGKVVAWYREKAFQHRLDEWTMEYGTLDQESRQLESFKYFRDRLVILKQCYDDIEPSTVTQFWYDRRNGPQFFQLMNALLVTILTAVTIFFGAASLGVASAQLRLDKGQSKGI